MLYGLIIEVFLEITVLALDQLTLARASSSLQTCLRLSGRLRISDGEGRKISC